MISGSVRDEIELIVPLEVVDSKGERRQIDFVLDTGFTGFLALSFDDIRQLGLVPSGAQDGQLADGRSSSFLLARLDVIWNGKPERIAAQILGEPLIGTRMLKGCELNAKFVTNGLVTITALNH